MSAATFDEVMQSIDWTKFCDAGHPLQGFVRGGDTLPCCTCSHEPVLERPRARPGVLARMLIAGAPVRETLAPSLYQRCHITMDNRGFGVLWGPMDEPGGKKP